MERDLAEENRRLKVLIDKLVARIEANQQIARRFQDFEYKLLEAASLPQLLELLIRQGPEHFRLQAMSLVLYDPEYVYEQLFEFLDLGHWTPRVQLRHTRDFFDDFYGAGLKPCLGELDPLVRARILPGSQVASCALLPLLSGGALVGSLHLGADDAERFTPDKAVDFMQHLAAVLALCLDRCVLHEQLRREGRQDPLTQVCNRAAFEQALELELARAERSHQPLSCCFVDLDHFKRINDQYGHLQGDICLREVALALQRELRKTDTLARFGGEEFVALLPNCGPERARATAERIRAAVAALEVAVGGGEQLSLSVSIGATSWEPASHRATRAQLAQALVRQADAAMYLVKQAGRNGVKWQPLVVP